MFRLQPPTSSTSIQWPRLDSNQRSPPCQGGVIPLHHETSFPVGPAGVEPAIHRVSDGCRAAWLRPEKEYPAGSAPASSSVAGWCLSASATGTSRARVEGVEPPASGFGDRRSTG